MLSFQCISGVFHSHRDTDWLTCGTFTLGAGGNQSTTWASDNPDPDWLVLLEASPLPVFPRADHRCLPHV
ncbi:hypothetical protein GJAV_G00071470 [Gymnothorax javanicus]|nr:hypothetical protein GJAV_G00071470 [Gymnothorax javanicus]